MTCVLSPHVPIRRPGARAERDQGEQRHDRVAHEAGAEQARHQHDADAGDERDLRRDREPVDLRSLDLVHGVASCASASLAVPPRDRRPPARPTVAESSSACLRVDAEGHDRGHQRHEHEPVAHAQVERLRRPRRTRLCIIRMNARSMYTEASATPVEAMIAIASFDVEDAEQDVELAHEVGRAGHGQRGERDDQEQRREHRRPEGHAAHLADVLRARPLVQQRR